MKLYYLADLFTLTETICGAALAAMVILRTPADYAVWALAIGVLCDAIDGPCARRFPYPSDGKRRWWREHAEQTDQISDIILGLAALLYIGYHISAPLGQYGFFAAYFIGIGTQVLVYPEWDGIECFDLQSTHPHLALKLVIFRRLLYAGGMLAGILVMILATSWSERAKITFCTLIFLCGFASIFLKKNRLTEDKTSLT